MERNHVRAASWFTGCVSSRCFSSRSWGPAAAIILSSTSLARSRSSSRGGGIVGYWPIVRMPFICHQAQFTDWIIAHLSAFLYVDHEYHPIFILCNCVLSPTIRISFRLRALFFSTSRPLRRIFSL